MESLNCSIHYHQWSYPTVNLFAWELPTGFTRELWDEIKISWSDSKVRTVRVRNATNTEDPFQRPQLTAPFGHLLTMQLL